MLDHIKFTTSSIVSKKHKEKKCYTFIISCFYLRLNNNLASHTSHVVPMLIAYIVTTFRTLSNKLLLAHITKIFTILKIGKSLKKLVSRTTKKR